MGLGLLLFLFGLGVYFVPAIKAYQEGKNNREAILALNIFLGWTVIGWAVALVWSYSKDSGGKPALVVAIPPALCSFCGKYSSGDAIFCTQCGKKLS